MPTRKARQDRKKNPKTAKPVQQAVMESFKQTKKK